MLSFYALKPSACSLWLIGHRNTEEGFPKVSNSTKQMKGLSIVPQLWSVTIGTPAPRWSKGERGRRAGNATSWIQLGLLASMLVGRLQLFWKFKLKRRDRQKERGQSAILGPSLDWLTSAKCTNGIEWTCGRRGELHFLIWAWHSGHRHKDAAAAAGCNQHAAAQI